MSVSRTMWARSTRSVAISLGLGLILGIVGCDDGVEHGSVQVGSKGSMAPPPPSKGAGSDVKKSEPKVMLPGGKKM